MQNTAAPSVATAAGSLIILAGPSGVGKNAVYSGAATRLGNIYRSVSVTTRAPRPGEENNVDYRFISEDEYGETVERGEFLEHAGVHGNHYGTPRTPVVEKLSAGIDVVLEIDVQGMHSVRAERPDAVKIFLAPPNMSVLEERLRGRGTESDADILKRLKNARKEMQHQSEFDYVIINDDLDKTIEQLCTIIHDIRCSKALLGVA